MKINSNVLEPAILHKDELEKLFQEYLYSDESFYYNGYAHGNVIPEIRAEDNVYQYAIMGKGRVYHNGEETRRVLGYVAYHFDPATDTASNFGLFSFDHGNVVVGEAVHHIMERLVKRCRGIEWRMVGGNPVQRSYDRFCKKYNGNVVQLHDVTKDDDGVYHDEFIDEFIYEVLCDKNKNKGVF